MPYPKFAAALRAAMQAQGISNAELARRVWGPTKDKRGYDVARNRDRIGHYLAGNSHPNRANLVKLADALGIPAERLRELHGGPKKGIASAPSHDDTVREVIGRLLAPFGDISSPRARAAALLKISRALSELAEAELAKPPQPEDDRG